MKDFFRNTWKHRAHVVLALPAFLVLLFFAYIPMSGLVIAFKEFNYKEGLWGSPWNNFANFKFLIQSKSMVLNMLRNTLMYYFIFTLLGQFLNIVLAISIDQFVFKRVGKVMQSIMIIPVFISYTAVQFIVYAYLSTDTGFINNVLNLNIKWYANAKLWPYILTTIKMWNGVGYGSVLYMSVLAGIDTQLYEAAQIDGASKWQQILHVTIPSLVPMLTVMLLLSVGGIMRSDTGLFYQVTRNSGILYKTTQVVDSYVLNAIYKVPKLGYPGAASFFQAVVGAFMMLFANFTVRKIAPENALF